MSQKFSFWAQLRRFVDATKEAVTYHVLSYIVSLVEASNKFDYIWRISTQKTAQKQPKKIISAGMKTFKILKLQNYKSDTNKTHIIYHLKIVFKMLCGRVFFSHSSVGRRVGRGRGDKNLVAGSLLEGCANLPLVEGDFPPSPQWGKP